MGGLHAFPFALIFCFLYILPQIFGEYYIVDDDDDFGASDIPDMRSNRMEDHLDYGSDPTTSKVGGGVGPGKSSASAGAGGRPSFDGIQKAYVANWKKVWDKAVKDSGSDSNAEFTAKVTSCAGELKYCSEDPIGEGPVCYMQCLLKGKPLLSTMYNAIHNTLIDLCSPIQTTYLEIFKSAKTGAGHLKTYRRFMEALEISEDDFNHAIPKLADAITVALIKYGKTSLTPLKRVITELEVSLEVQQQGRSYMTTSNPACRTLQMYDPVESIVETLYKDPAASDVLIPGFAMFSTVSKYLSSRVTQHMTVLREGMRMFVGKSTGIICNADTPTGNCDNLGRYPMPGFPVPPPAAGGSSFVSLINPLCASRDANNGDFIPSSAKSGNNKPGLDKDDKLPVEPITPTPLPGPEAEEE